MIRPRLACEGRQLLHIGVNEPDLLMAALVGPVRESLRKSTLASTTRDYTPTVYLKRAITLPQTRILESTGSVPHSVVACAEERKDESQERAHLKLEE